MPSVNAPTTVSISELSYPRVQSANSKKHLAGKVGFLKDFESLVEMTSFPANQPLVCRIRSGSVDDNRWGVRVVMPFSLHDSTCQVMIDQRMFMVDLSRLKSRAMAQGAALSPLDSHRALITINRKGDDYCVRAKVDFWSQGADEDYCLRFRAPNTPLLSNRSSAEFEGGTYKPMDHVEREGMGHWPRAGSLTQAYGQRYAFYNPNAMTQNRVGNLDHLSRLLRKESVMDDVCSWGEVQSLIDQAQARRQAADAQAGFVEEKHALVDQLKCRLDNAPRLNESAGFLRHWIDSVESLHSYLLVWRDVGQRYQNDLNRAMCGLSRLSHEGGADTDFSSMSERVAWVQGSAARIAKESNHYATIQSRVDAQVQWCEEALRDARSELTQLV